MQKLNTQNPNFLTWTHEDIKFDILGGIRLEGLDHLRVTIRAIYADALPIRHNLDLYNDNQLTQLVRKCAERFEMSSSYMYPVIGELVNLLEEYRIKEINKQKSEADSHKKRKKLTAEEAEAAMKLLKSKNLLEVINDLIGQSGIVGEVDNRLLMYLIFTSRLMANPLHVVSLGSSGSGKSHLQESVASLLPEEDVIEITTLSENAFYYFKRQELVHKLILIEDLDGAESALYPIRELQSKKRISKTIAKKNSRGETRTTHLVVEGPVSIGGCTTREKVYEDNANRSFLIYLDESAEQNDRIVAYQQAVSAAKLNGIEKELAAEVLRNSQRLLRPLKVVNPYAPFLKLPQSVLKPRRTNSHYLHFIEAITFFHQYQRESKVEKDTGVEFIETTLEDIENANLLLKDVLLRKSDQLSGACRNYFEKLKLYLIGSDQKQVSNSEMSLLFKVPLTTIKRHHYALMDHGYLKTIKQKGSKAFYYQVVSYDEYQALKNQINTALDEPLEVLKKRRPEFIEGDLPKKPKPKRSEPSKSKNGLIK